MEEPGDDETAPSQASGPSPTPVVVLTTPKLSELHMNSDSTLFTRLDTSRAIDNADMSLIEPKPTELTKKKFIVRQSNGSINILFSTCRQSLHLFVELLVLRSVA